jgi:glycosyltransferase involved in cell wall biosynthesis
MVLTQSRGGPVDVTVALARALARRGTVEPVILGPPPESSAGPVDGLWIDARMPRKSDLRGARGIVTLARQAGCTLLHGQDRRAMLAIGRLTRPGVPTIGTYHGVPVECVGAAGRLGRRDGTRAQLALRLDRWSLAGLTRILTPSCDMADYLRSEVGVPAARIIVVPNAVERPAGIRPVTRIRRFITVGSFTRNKGVDVLIRAFAVLAARSQEVELILVGDGEARPACEALAAELRVADLVSFLGYRTDVPALLAEADVFVLPSREENAPIALLEAMAAGRVCIASAVGGVPGLLPPGSGLLVTPGDVGALTGALAEVYDEPARAAAMGAAAAATAQRHDVDLIAGTYERLYAQLRGER